MSIARPSPEQIQAIGSDLHIDVSDSEAHEFAAPINGNLDIYEVLDQLPDDLPPVKYPRAPGTRPLPADNLGWESFHIVGHSMSGVLAQRVVLDGGDSVKSAIPETVPTLCVVALGPEISDGKAPCAGNSGAISKRGNAASADFRAQPAGPGPFLPGRSKATICWHRRSMR